MAETVAETRRYTISIEIEVYPQDDFAHFQPGTVVGRAPQLGAEWVSGNDAEALRDFFNFFVNWNHLPKLNDAKSGIEEIVARAIEGGR